MGAAVKSGADSGDPVLVLVDSAAGVGDLDDIEELLADVGGDYNSCRSSLGLFSAEDGVGPLVGTGGAIGTIRGGIENSLNSVIL
jgi:hypothetical protein